MGSCVESNNHLGKIITGHDGTDSARSGDEARGVSLMPFGHEALDRLAALQEAIFEGEALSGDSAEFIREDRAERSKPQA